MAGAQFVLEDDDSEDQRLRSSDLPRYSEDSIDELGLDRHVFEKDERFRDETKMELGDQEEQDFLYGRVPVSLWLSKIFVDNQDLTFRSMSYRLVSQAAPQTLRSPVACDSGSGSRDRHILGKGIQPSELYQEGGIQAYHHGARLQWDVCTQVCRDDKTDTPLVRNLIHALANSGQGG